MRIPKRILERRRSVRIQEILPFTIGHRGFEMEAVTVNISTSGALCLVEKDIPMMTKLDIVLSVPVQRGVSLKRTRVRIKGVIVRKEKDEASDKFFVAIFFSSIRPKDQVLLKKFIERRLKK